MDPKIARGHVNGFLRAAGENAGRAADAHAALVRDLDRAAQSGGRFRGADFDRPARAFSKEILAQGGFDVTHTPHGFRGKGRVGGRILAPALLEAPGRSPERLVVVRELSAEADGRGWKAYQRSLPVSISTHTLQRFLTRSAGGLSDALAAFCSALPLVAAWLRATQGDPDFRATFAARVPGGVLIGQLIPWHPDAGPECGLTGTRAGILVAPDVDRPPASLAIRTFLDADLLTPVQHRVMRLMDEWAGRFLPLFEAENLAFSPHVPVPESLVVPLIALDLLTRHPDWRIAFRGRRGFEVANPFREEAETGRSQENEWVAVREDEGGRRVLLEAEYDA